MSDEREPVPVRIGIAAAVVAAGHFALLLGTAAMLMRAAPATKRYYDDFGVKLPYATEMVLRVAMVMEDYSWAVALAGVVVLAADVGVFVLLASRRRSRPLAWAWVVLVTLGLFAVPGLSWFALNLPHVKLLEGLAK